MDICHFCLVGSGNPNSSNLRATQMAAATLRPPLSPLVVELNEYCTWNAPTCFSWCSINVACPKGTATMGLLAHLHDGAPMALIVCVGSFRLADFLVESFGLLNPSLREKKRHSGVCKGRAVEGWACKGTPQSPGVVQHQGTTRSIAMGGRAMECDFSHCSAGGGCCTAPTWRQHLVAMGLRCPMLAPTPPGSAH